MSQFNPIYGCRLFIATAGIIVLTSCAACPTKTEVEQRLVAAERRVELLESQLSESEKDLATSLELLSECNASCVAH